MNIRIERKWQDCWIGVYWDCREDSFGEIGDIWICLIPCFPIHISWWKYRSLTDSIPLCDLCGKPTGNLDHASCIRICDNCAKGSK